MSKAEKLTCGDDDENVGAEVEEISGADGGDVTKLASAHSPRSATY